MTPLDILRVGAVTPVGLSAPSTCAAFRAGMKALKSVYYPTFPAEPIVGGKVPGSIRLRRTYTEWLVSLATRALAESVHAFEYPDRTALLLNLPEAERRHPELSGDYAGAILAAVQQRLGIQFHIAEATCGGHSGVLAALLRGRQLLDAGAVSFCCIGGVDSLVNAHDINRLQAASRLKDEHHPMGVMPSEGAAFFLVASAGGYCRALARIVGVGVATANGGVSSAPARRDAFERALRDAAVHESKVAFVVTDFTGERARAIDYMIAEMRTFRTIRQSMPQWTFVESVGDTRAAAGALTVVLAASAHANGYAPGLVGICAASSDTGSHAACVIQKIIGSDSEVSPQKGEKRRKGVIA